MKIINKEEFIQLPEGTLFTEWKPCIFGEICIKGETISTESGDFFYQPLIQIDAGGSDEEAALQIESAQTGKSFKLTLQCEHRDGHYDWGAMYAIWEEKDFEDLAMKLFHLVHREPHR